MICTVQNAFPSNNCVDSLKSTKFKFTFYGDHCLGADFFIYNAVTGDICEYIDSSGEVNKKRLLRTSSGKGYYNGEEMSVNYKEDYYTNNGKYFWKARLYEDIDFSFGKTPSTFVANGTIQETATILTLVEPNVTVVGDNYIYIEKNLSFSTPCYCYVKGSGYKTVLAYDANRGLIKLSSPYPEKPAVGTDIMITKYKTNYVIDYEKDYLFIEPGININADTYKPTTSSSETPCCYMKIGNEWRAITGYNKRTGLVYLESSFPYGTSTEVGVPYEIYCNYSDTPEFYFTTKETPTISTNMVYANECIKCTAELTNQYYPIKYYYWEIYEENNLVEKSEKIYNGIMEYYVRKIITGRKYVGKITVVTQDGIEISDDSASCTISTYETGITNLQASVDNDKNAVKLTWVNTAYPTSYIISRQAVGSNVTEYLETVLENTNTYYDYKAGDSLGYVYYVTPKTSSAVYATNQTVAITDFSGWTLYFLDEIPYEKPSSTITNTRIYYEYMYGEKQFKVVSTWKIDLNANGGEITQNLSRELITGYSNKPFILNSELDYDSFSLSFMLANLSCSYEGLTNFTQDKYELWKSYISSKRPVLIKDVKGNVWFGNIVAHKASIDPASSYRLYTITIDFVQTRDIEKTRILTS